MKQLVLYHFQIAALADGSLRQFARCARCRAKYMNNDNSPYHLEDTIKFHIGDVKIRLSLRDTLIPGYRRLDVNYNTSPPLSGDLRKLNFVTTLLDDPQTLDNVYQKIIQIFDYDLPLTD